MSLLLRWVLPIVVFAVGIAIFTGAILPQLPARTGLRSLLGIVVILFAAYRFVIVRTLRAPDHRRIGGARPRPWEDR